MSIMGVLQNGLTAQRAAICLLWSFGPEDINAVSRLRNGQGAWTWEKTVTVFQLLTTEPPEQKKT